MITSRVGRALLVLACAVTISSAWLVPARGAGEPSSGAVPVRLQTGGGYFRDAQGRVVILHGVDWNDGPGFTAQDADFLAANGFNFVRLGIAWAGLVPQRPGTPGQFTIDQTYLDQIEQIADVLAADHIYYMLDFHQGCFIEWPAWAIPYDQGVGQATNTSALPSSACYLIPSGSSRAADNLIKDPDPDNAALPGGSLATIPVSEVWTDYQETWRQVAAQFRDRDYLMGYDFINEPGSSKFWQCDLPGVGCPEVDEKIQAFEENALAGIREADPISSSDPAVNGRAGIGVFEPVSVEGTAGGATGFGDPPVTDPKVAWSAHIYCGDFAEPVPATPVTPATGCRQLLTPAFDGTAGVGGIAGNAAHLTGADTTVTGAQRVPGAQPAPQLMGEFGSSTDPNVIEDTLVLADPRFVSWSYWQYRSYPTWQIGIFANTSDEQCRCFNTASPRADVLIRPYAQATAGTPVSYSYDPSTRIMNYSYKPSSDRSMTTDIVVPAHYLQPVLTSPPNGYQASVTGGVVVSPPGARYLEVRSTSDSIVTVMVKPT